MDSAPSKSLGRIGSPNGDVAEGGISVTVQGPPFEVPFVVYVLSSSGLASFSCGNS